MTDLNLSHKPNRLINETSPYLLQHAHNPVDWYPWGPEAIETARSADKPILLSIGYAACHWCHVMERESFEDEAVAELMNSRFVCIKVDREERPDIDAIYMDAVQAMTGHGGWPMTMFLSPEGIPFYGGTYFPPEDRHGLPGFARVLQGISEAWVSNRQEVIEQGKNLIDQIERSTRPVPSKDPLTNSLISHAVGHIAEEFDETYGGFGTAPKFPQPAVIEFLLRGAGLDLGRSREMIATTLTRMATGGMYDQLGGGFSRYSVDAMWLVPHFEKMLYDNALLARIYTHAWQATKNPLYERIARETLAYLTRDMMSPEGAFYASEDADSEGEEGKFYVWTYEEFSEIAPEAVDYFRVRPDGNFEGANILTGRGEPPPADAREKLLARRASRVRPARDEKVITSWNALAIGSLAEAGAAFNDAGFVEAAARCAGFILDNLYDDSGLLHVHKDGVSKVTGMLEDHAYLADALLTLWEVTFQPRWLEASVRLTDSMLELFWDDDGGGMFATGSHHEKLIIRQKEIVESATPAPNAIASIVLQKLAVITGEKKYTQRAEEILRLAHLYMARAPQATATFLSSLYLYLYPTQEIVLISSDQPSDYELASECWESFLPNRVMAGGPVGNIASPMLEGKQPIDGKTTAFVCENYSCKSPVTDRAALKAQLAR